MKSRRDFDNISGKIKPLDNARELYKLMYELPKQAVVIGEPYDGTRLYRINDSPANVKELDPKVFLRKVKYANKNPLKASLLTNAGLGFILESNKTKNGPRRGKQTTFLVESMERAEGDLVQEAENRLMQMLSLNGSYLTQIKDALKSLGNVGQDAIMNTIADRPLIDTSQLLQSVTFKVRKYSEPFEIIKP